eukprot:6727793-Pyramimonas_sp.AAC.1
MIHDAPRSPQDNPKCPKEFPDNAPKRPKCFKTLRAINGFGVLTVSLPKPIRGLKMAPRVPNWAPTGAQ